MITLVVVDGVTKVSDFVVDLNANFAELDTKKADKSNVLELDNTDVYTPINDYNPATKKYVDDHSTGGNFYIDNSLIGDQDGVNKIFSTNYDYITSTLNVFVNGVLQFIIDDYTINSSKNIIFIYAPEVDSTIVAQYAKKI